MSHSTSDNESFVAIQRCMQAISKKAKRRQRRSPSQNTTIRHSVTQTQGFQAENEAKDFLVQAGLVCLRQNYRLGRYEIDLIMREGELLIFVEVRLRRPSKFATAAESVDKMKQKKLIRAAKLYLQQIHCPPSCRFDIIAHDGQRIEWIKDAFSLDSHDH